MDPFIGNLILIICFVVGSGLILLEAFMPGFGAAGFVGIVLEIVAIVFTGLVHGAGWAIGATFLVILLIGLAIFFSYRSAVKGRLSRSALVLKDEESAAVSENAVSGLARWVGLEGIVATPLRPAGFVDIGGTRVSAATSGTFLEKGTPVLIQGVEGDHLVVLRK